MLSSVEIRMIQYILFMDFQNIFLSVYIFRGWYYCTVIPGVKDLLAFMHGRLCEDLLRGRNAYF